MADNKLQIQIESNEIKQMFDEVEINMIRAGQGSELWNAMVKIFSLPSFIDPLIKSKFITHANGKTELLTWPSAAFKRIHAAVITSNIDVLHHEHQDLLKKAARH